MSRRRRRTRRHPAREGRTADPARGRAPRAPAGEPEGQPKATRGATGDESKARSEATRAPAADKSKARSEATRAPAADESKARPASESQGPAAGRRRGIRGLAVQIGVPLLVFAVVSAIAEVAGAANLCTALGIGQVAFVFALLYVLLRD